MNKILDNIIDRPYSIRVFPKSKDQDFFIVEIPELKGCISEGTTLDEAITNLKDSLKLWLEIALENDVRIPEPSEFGATDISRLYSDSELNDTYLGNFNEQDKPIYMSTLDKYIENIITRPYSYRVFPKNIEQDFFIVEIPELEGCISEGITLDDAIINLKDSLKLWIEIALEHKIIIPAPAKYDFNNESILNVEDEYQKIHNEIFSEHTFTVDSLRKSIRYTTSDYPDNCENCNISNTKRYKEEPSVKTKDNKESYDYALAA